MKLRFYDDTHLKIGCGQISKGFSFAEIIEELIMLVSTYIGIIKSSVLSLILCPYELFHNLLLLIQFC